MASEICRPGRKADCDGPITSANAAFNLTTINLDMHLYSTLQQEMGLKSFILAGFSTFGTSATRVALTQRGSKLCEKKYLTAAMKSCLMILQLCLKNRALYPSGPGDLLSGMENKAFLISSLVIGRLAVSFEVSEIVLGYMLVMSSGKAVGVAVSRRSYYDTASFPISCESVMVAPSSFVSLWILFLD